MAPGASVTYTCSLANVTTSFTNTVVASGTGSAGGTVTASDTAQVTVNVPFAPPAPTPAIAIVKDPKGQTISTGGTATFKITVTNAGGVKLTNTTVTDPLSPNCDRNLGDLEVGASKSYTCTKADVASDFTNVASVTAKPPTGSPVSAKDHGSVKVAPFTPPSKPVISIVKSPKAQTLTTKIVTTQKKKGGPKSTSVSYGTAFFTITVTNKGNEALQGVKVTDPMSPGCDKNIGNLPVGGTKSYPCSAPSVKRDFTNVATATGHDSKGKKVKDSDHAKVNVKVKTTNKTPAKFTG
jgi:uncharacterized repeat protein (TIGR01451 family)